MSQYMVSTAGVEVHQIDAPDARVLTAVRDRRRLAKRDQRRFRDLHDRGLVAFGAPDRLTESGEASLRFHMKGTTR